MSNASNGAGRGIRMRLALRRALDRYPELRPAPGGTRAYVALGAVVLMAATFAGIFIAQSILLHASYRTHAEDLGIMDQALWNTVSSRGSFLHQTICDTVGDTNCLGDIPRTAIHFEPLLLLIAPQYAVARSPLTLIAIQTLVVAAGAIPAYWIASRRLQSTLAGVGFAALYLAFPALQSATLGDFHAVTLSAALIMFALYFMVARNNVGLWITCILAMTTKEEIPLLVAMIGLSIALLQRRWRLGLSLVGIAAVYLGVALVVLHLSSPIGHSPTAGRYAYLGGTPLQAAEFVLTHPLRVVRDYLLAPDRITYLRQLLSPTGYLALLSPLTLLIAGPEAAINLLSADPLMRSGDGQYNAPIVPVIILATIESVALLASLAGRTAARMPPDRRAGIRNLVERVDAALAARIKRLRLSSVRVPQLALAMAMLVALGVGAHEQRDHGFTPLTWGFHWPQVTAHDELANSLVAMIPPDASLSAQSDLVPHVSQRRFMYLFPDHAASANYVFLDVTGNIFPLQNAPATYVTLVQRLLASGDHRVVAARDGYLLLARVRGPSAAHPSSGAATRTDELGDFYSFAYANSPPPHEVAVHFGSSLEMVGYDVWPTGDTHLDINGLSIVTYWRVTGVVPQGSVPRLVLVPAQGQSQAVTDLPTAEWLPMEGWTQGTTMVVASRALTPNVSPGLLQFGVRVLAGGGGGELEPLTPTVESRLAQGQGYPRADLATGTVLFSAQQVMP